LLLLVIGTGNVNFVLFIALSEDEYRQKIAQLELRLAGEASEHNLLVRFLKLFSFVIIRVITKSDI